MTVTAFPPIGILDSGVGGLTVAKALREVMPCQSYIYYGDSLHAPYGTKTHDVILNYVENIVDFFINEGVQCVVFACNTISGRISQHIKKLYPKIQFITMIDAGVQGISSYLVQKGIGLFATKATIEEGYYEAQIRKIFPLVPIATIACPELVELAERGVLSGIQAEKYIQTAYAKMPEHIDCFILGCTHFPLFMPVFEKYLPENASIYNPSEAVAYAVRDSVRYATACTKVPFSISLYSSGSICTLQEIAYTYGVL